MLSNLASYIFGAEDSDSQNGAAAAPPAEARTQPTLSDDEDWVVVSGNTQPPLTLGSLNEIEPRPTRSSSTISEAGTSTEEAAAEVELQLPHHQVARRQVAAPFGSSNALLPQLKAVRAAQRGRQKDQGKPMSAKALGRHNKAVKCNQSHAKKKCHISVSMKGAGGNKQLKLC